VHRRSSRIAPSVIDRAERNKTYENEISPRVEWLCYASLFASNTLSDDAHIIADDDAEHMKLLVTLEEECGAIARDNESHGTNCWILSATTSVLSSSIRGSGDELP
jgi:hypothetical protein